MKADHTIADTAFWVNVDRARQVGISKDIYAELWVTPESEALWKEMARKVYPNSEYSVSLRNRFYLERMEIFGAGRERPAIINIAAGFTMYPYLLPENYRNLEVDQADVIDFKKVKTAEFLAEGKIPVRSVDYVSADLVAPAQLDALGNKMIGWLGGTEALAVMEGLTYYLPKGGLLAIFSRLAEILPVGSRLAFEHWPQDAGEYPAVNRFHRHMEEAFGWKNRDFTTFSEDEIRDLPGFRVMETLTTPEVERAYSETRVLQQKENRLPHLYKVLERIP